MSFLGKNLSDRIKGMMLELIYHMVEDAGREAIKLDNDLEIYG